MDKIKISMHLETIIRGAEELLACVDDRLVDPADYVGIIEDEAVKAFMEINDRTGEDPDDVLEEILGEK